MSQNFSRQCTLSIGEGSGPTVKGGGDTDLRVTFQIQQWGGQTPNMAVFTIYNPSQQTADKLKAQQFAKVSFSAGYDGNVGLIFTGEVRQTFSGHESATDTFVRIFAADRTLAYNKARVSTTLAAGHTPQDRVNAAVNAMAPYDVRLGLVNVDLSQPRFPRGIPLIGMARDVLRDIALTKSALWSIQNGSLAIVDHRQSIPGNTFEMNGRTGMIGWPQQTQSGIVVTSLLNSKLQPHVNLKINPSSINRAEQDNDPFSQTAPETNLWLNKQNVEGGIYNIFKINRRGDTRGSEWSDESWCIGSGGLPSPSQTNQNYWIGPN